MNTVQRTWSKKFLQSKVALVQGEKILDERFFLNSYPTKGWVKGYEMRCTSFIEGLWIERMPADHAWRTITGANEMKRNERDECGENG